MKYNVHVPARHLTVQLWLMLAVPVLAAAATDELAQQRDTFRTVMHEQAAGHAERARQFAFGLENYPLFPYFRYADLQRRLTQLPEAEVAEFLAAYDNSYLADKLRSEWLRQLGRSQQWTLFLRYYRPQQDTVLRCLQLRARIDSGGLEGLLADTKALWLSGTSRPPECDAAFAQLSRSELMTDDLRWQRIRLAMIDGNPGLARFTALKLASPARKSLFESWFRAFGSPLMVLRGPRLTDAATSREIMIYALGRLARQDVDQARELWPELSARYSFTADESGQAAKAIAIAAAASNHSDRIKLLDAVPSAQVDSTVERYRLREGIAQQAWEALARWTANPPTTDDDPLRWRYWHSQALAHTGRPEEARALLQELAKERDYYGFLAADKIGQTYAFNFVPVRAEPAEIGALMAIPGVARARELQLLNMSQQAGREWAYELAHLQRRQLEVAAAVAAGWGWPDRAIVALGQAASYDDLELRFPVLYADLAFQHAAKQGLDPARVLAIIRAESAFAVDARSPVGALGLMQVMPDTGRATAQRAGLRFDNPSVLVQAPANIAIGTVYLRDMLARFHGNFALAAAAYNAGPQRARAWQADACVPAERWIESIPFPETRSYVRRAFFYAAIYQWRLARPIARLDDVMTPIPPRDAPDTAGCTT